MSHKSVGPISLQVFSLVPVQISRVLARLLIRGPAYNAHEDLGPTRIYYYSGSRFGYLERIRARSGYRF